MIRRSGCMIPRTPQIMIHLVSSREADALGNVDKPSERGFWRTVPSRHLTHHCPATEPESQKIIENSGVEIGQHSWDSEKT